MYSTLFLDSEGSNLYVLLGALEQLKEYIKETKIYNVIGNASLVLFLKANGYTYEQTFNKIKSFQLITSMINGYSCFPEDQEEKKTFIKNWLISICNEKHLITANTNLQDIYNLTNIFPAFILWSRTEKKIVNLNPTSAPKINFVDCVMASLCGIGIYNTYSVENIVFSNLSNINPLPFYNLFSDNPSQTLLISISFDFDPKMKNGILGPFEDIENEIIYQYKELKDYRYNNFSNNDIKKCILYSYLIRGDSSEEEKLSQYTSGKHQAQSFIEGKDTKYAASAYQSMIMNQP